LSESINNSNMEA